VHRPLHRGRRAVREADYRACGGATQPEVTEARPLPRAASRIVLLDPEDRVLLFRLVDVPTGRWWWFTSGGGLDPGETHEAAALPGRPAAAGPGGGVVTGVHRRRALSQTGVRVSGLDNVTLARATMGTSLGFHIVFAVFGVGLPALLVVAEGLWLRTGDEVWLGLARRWSRAFAILFAVGAVSGTVLSFELGLLWPRFMAFSGSIIGLPFSAEGFAFFIEAIFLGLYLYGWKRLTPFQHWLTGIPIALSGAASSVFVVMANAWMNSPTGFHLAAAGRLQSVDPLAAALNPSTPTEDPHMLVSAYVVTGSLVASVYAIGLLRRRDDPLHRRGLVLGMSMAAVAIVLAGITGDTSARFIYQAQPAK